MCGRERAKHHVSNRVQSEMWKGEHGDAQTIATRATSLNTSKVCYTYIHPLYMYIHHIYTTYTPNTPLNTRNTPYIRLTTTYIKQAMKGLK